MSIDFQSVLRDHVVGKDGAKVELASALKGKIVLLYFSAHWCPPCRQFTPELIRVYKQWKASNADVELIFVSSDQDDEAFSEYYSEMPWLTVDFAAEEARQSVNEKFSIRSIPTLAVLTHDGHIITKDGRADVSKLKEAALDQWKSKASSA